MAQRKETFKRFKESIFQLYSDFCVVIATEVEAAEQGVPEELSVAITSMVAKYPRGIPLVKFKQVFKVMTSCV